MNAHLRFHPDLPAWGMDAGADLWVVRVHETGGAIEQSSCFHVEGDRVDPDVLSAREELVAEDAAGGRRVIRTEVRLTLAPGGHGSAPV